MANNIQVHQNTTNSLFVARKKVAGECFAHTHSPSVEMKCLKPTEGIVTEPLKYISAPSLISAVDDVLKLMVKTQHSGWLYHLHYCDRIAKLS